MKKKYKYALVALGGVWLVAMIVLSPQFIAAHRETEKVLLVFDEYSSSLVNQRFEEAYQQCGSDFHRALPYDQFVSVQESLQAQLGPLKSVRRSSYHVHGSGNPIQWRAVVDADLFYDKKTLRFQFVFHKEGERWVLFASLQL